MSDIGVSVIVPTLNEERDIDSFLTRVSRALDARGGAWEILVVDDGSSDRTPSLVERWSDRDRRIRLLRGAHRGKGSAIRRGMLAARGAWRMMADADLSVAPQDWPVFLDATNDRTAADIVIGSREAPGGRRIGEPLSRHLFGRVFNWIVQLLAVPGIHDTQCGFKLLSQRAAETLVPHLTIEGFAFDVELLYLARRSGLRIREVGVVWTCRTESRVRMSRGLAAFADIARIRWRDLRGRYDEVRLVDAARPGETRGAP
jgi:glycosyltransferase involved in cell wall biosynthesis